METLVLDGKNYVKASKAARDLGYATDYVGQLCRSGKVAAHLIGRTWYVAEEELGTHRIEKKRNSRVKARAYAKKALEEHKLKVVETQNIYKNIDIQYESDPTELIPETRKIIVESIPEKQYQSRLKEYDIDQKPEILNKGEKIVMSGSIEVVDVTDELPDTVTLSPTRIRKSTPIEVRSEEHSVEIVPLSKGLEVDSEGMRLSFEEKFQLVDTPTSQADQEEMPNSAIPEQQGSILGYSIFCLALLLFVLATIPIFTSITYSSIDGISQKNAFSIEKIVSIIQIKI